jgi:CBS domain-containing protein
VKDGAIGLFRDENILVDKCDEGDIFGLRALVRNDYYRLNAKALEESIIYSISLELLEAIINHNTQANKYLMASFVTNTRNPYATEHSEALFANDKNLNNDITSFTEVQSAEYSKDPVTCSPNTTIKDAAQVMTQKRVGSIIITESDKPLGIITDKDLRTKIATGRFSINDTVTQIMSSPVITYPEHITVAEAQIAMLQHRITHLCITEDGTPETILKGILSEHDIIVIRGNNPSVLVKEIKRAQNAETLKYIRSKAQNLLQRYLEQGIPIAFISKIISAINDTITKRVIAISISEMNEAPPTAFGWMALGSQGRKEQLLLTDQDNALVFEDVEDTNYNYTKQYFLDLSKRINDKLNTVGFEYCPAEMMASNPKWCLSVTEWIQQFNSWITQPDQDKIMLCTIFFDFDLIYGEKALIHKMSESIFEAIDSYEIFLNFLGLNALKNPPPLSFFRQFVVEHSGEHKNEFDLKARAMMPLVDAARVLILSNNITDCNSTVLRYEKMAEIEPQNKELYLSCANAFKILLRFRTVDGLKDKDSGRFLDLKTLNKADRLKLKSCFKPIKDVQELISTRFRLSQMM